MTLLKFKSAPPKKYIYTNTQKVSPIVCFHLYVLHAYVDMLVMEIDKGILRF
jgi:hypothetical protein